MPMTVSGEIALPGTLRYFIERGSYSAFDAVAFRAGLSVTGNPEWTAAPTSRFALPVVDTTGKSVAFRSVSMSIIVR